ncbi:MAG: T9SS type A sorting domain-containing protein, partial [candidate division WOR-3 bacterium]
TMAFGDFDSDGQNEFIVGNGNGYYQLWECIGNDNYQVLQQRQLPTFNIKDCFTVPDADGDGKLEFVVKGYVVPDARTDCFIFEATGNNTYQMIKSFHLPNAQHWNYSGGYSDAGDIDGDSIPEICLEAASYVYIIKSAGNDSFYVWQTLPGNSLGSSIRITNDLDNNGLKEIVISGNNQTRIYEKTPTVTWFCPVRYDTFWANDTVYPRWKLDETMLLDSLRLYWAHPILGCHLIYQGLPQDTICQWIVPDTQSNMGNKLWLVVKGNGRYDSTSSPVFYIKKRTGVEETKISQSTIRNPKLEIYPNPVYDKLTIQYAVPEPSMVKLVIYNVLGQVEQTLFDGYKPAGIYEIEHKKPLTSGVYFVKLFVDEKVITKKCVILKN